MCDFSNETLDPNKEWFVDSPFVSRFVQHVDKTGSRLSVSR
jgi:hypothetical protein